MYSLEKNLKYSFNQLKLPSNYNSENENSIYKLNKENYKTFNLDLKKLSIEPKIKRTDFLNAVFASPNRILSEKVKNLLQDFKLPPHRFFPLDITHEKTTSKYFLLFIDFDVWDYVNFSQSDFYGENEYNERHTIQLNSKKEYLKFLKEKLVGTRPEFYFEVDKDGVPTVESNQKYYEFRRNTYYSLQYKCLNLYKDISKNFDLIQVYGQLYISENLQKLIKENKITGIKSEKANKISISDENMKKPFSLKSILKNPFKK